MVRYTFYSGVIMPVLLITQMETGFQGHTLTNNGTQISIQIYLSLKVMFSKNTQFSSLEEKETVLMRLIVTKHLLSVLGTVVPKHMK